MWRCGLIAVCLVGCGDDGSMGSTAGGAGSGSAGTTSGGSSGSTASSSASASTSASATSTSMGVTTATTDEPSSTSDDTDPGLEPPCGFWDTLCMLAEGKTSPIDCGVVLLADDDATWQAATECASTAAAAQEGFKVAFQQPSDDSFVFEGFYGVVGFVYGTGRLYTDTFGDPMLGAYTCTSVALNDICDVGNSAHCLECLGPGEVTPLDCAM